MAARQIIVPGAMPSRDANGRALPAKFRFYEPGAALTTPATVYTDNTLTVPHDFPILSDAAGRWPAIWADEADSFDVGWTDQTFDATISGPFTGVTPASDAVLASVALCDIAAAAAAASALMAQAAVSSATGAPLTGTSSTSLSIGTGQKTLVLHEDGLLFSDGQIIVAAVSHTLGATKPLNQMIGTVLSYDQTSKALLFNVSTHSEPDGVGPYAAWTVGLSGPGSVQSVAGLTGIIGAAALKAALAMTAADITDFNQRVDARVIGLSSLL
jgi:hypothetical protein